MLIEIDKNLEISFYSAILLFNLALNLKIKGCWKFLLDFQEVKIKLQKLWVKNQTLIINNWVRQIVFLYYPFDNDFCKAKSINNDLNWLII